jgi:hypothetical protein
MATRSKSKPPELDFEQIEMLANFYDAACDYPQESFEQVTRRLLGIKGFMDKSAVFKQDCRNSFERGRQK